MSFEERLIEAVRDHEVLYNLKHINYRRTDIKEKIWQQIADNLNTTVDHCKKRWKSLRDKFNKIKRIDATSSSGSAAQEPTQRWKYFFHLTFLKNFNKEEETHGNYSSYSSDDNYNDLICLEQTPEVVQKPAKRKRYQDKDDILEDFRKVLNSATDAIEKESGPKSSTAKLFEALAQRIDEANLSSAVLNDLHQGITNYVYDVINAM